MSDITPSSIADRLVVFADLADHFDLTELATRGRELADDVAGLDTDEQTLWQINEQVSTLGTLWEANSNGHNVIADGRDDDQRKSFPAAVGDVFDVIAGLL